MAETDERLYQRFSAGDKAALRTLVERHRIGLTLFLYGYVHNMDDAEDLQMETFAALVCGDARFSGKSSFKSWLYGVARNQARMFLRRNSAFFRLLGRLPIPAERGQPELSLLQTERERMLYAALDQLPRDYRQTIYLIEIDGMSAEEAAHAMGKTKAQVYHLLSRGKSALRKALEGMGYNAES